MGFPALHFVTADELNGLFQWTEAAMTGVALGLSASAQDLPGASVTVAVSGAHAFALVLSTFDVSPTVTAGSNTFVGTTVVDGVDQSGQALCDDHMGRVVVTQQNMVPLTAGSHTLKLQAKKIGGTFASQPQHSRIAVLLVDLP